MGIITYTSRADTTVLETPADFPKCVCGGLFKLTEYRKKKKKHLEALTCVCIECNEYFVSDCLENASKDVLHYQSVRAEKGTSFKESDI